MDKVYYDHYSTLGEAIAVAEYLGECPTCGYKYKSGLPHNEGCLMVIAIEERFKQISNPAVWK